MTLNAADQRAKTRAATLSIASNTGLVIMKLWIGLAIGSFSIVSDAIHSGMDLVAAIIAWASIKKSGRPADDEYHYGHGKIENVAGTVEAGLIFAAAAFIIWEAGKKLTTGHIEIESLGIGAAVMGLSALVNHLVSRHLFRVAKRTDSVALEADAMHLRTDVHTSLGVFAGLIAIKATGIAILDPIIAILVALMIIKAAWDLTCSAFFHILDVKLPDEEESRIHGALDRFRDRFIEYHKLRTRKSGHSRYIDMHLVVPRQMTVEAGHNLSDLIVAEIQRLLPYSHVLVHIEPCPGGCERCVSDCPKTGTADRHSDRPITEGPCPEKPF